MSLYHYELGFPELRRPNGQLRLVYGNHAKESSKHDRYGNLFPLLPNCIHTNNCQLIEMEVENDQIQKLVYRTSLTEVLDIVLVVSPSLHSSGVWFVRTVWANKKTDTHRTLDLRKYVKP